MLEPLLVVDTVRLPVGVSQLTEYATVAVPPAGTLTVCGFGLLTVQFAATPDRATLWLPAGVPAHEARPLVWAGGVGRPPRPAPHPLRTLPAPHGGAVSRQHARDRTPARN